MLDATTDLAGMLKDSELLATKLYLGGSWVNGTDTAFDVSNPARGDVIATVENAGRAQIADAIDQGYIAQKDWAARTPRQRFGAAGEHRCTVAARSTR